MLVIAGLAFAVYLFGWFAPRIQSFGLDAYAYWLVDVPGTYDIPHRADGSFPYSPPAALIASSFSIVPLTTFVWLWTALLVATVIWIGGSGGWIVVAFAMPMVALELYHGNIHILLAAAVLLGFRHPWTWSFVLLTKFTAGVGLLWFAVRGEWRSLGIALGATGVACAVSFVIAPYLWPQWVEYLMQATTLELDPRWTNLIGVPLWVRLLAAAVLVIWGAATDRRWTLLVATTLALPVLWFHGLAVLVGLVEEWRRADPLARASLATRALERLGRTVPTRERPTAP